MSKIKDEKHAIELTIPIWEYLAKTGEDDKMCYDGNLFNLYLAGCPLCDFFNANNKNNFYMCFKCPLCIKEKSCKNNGHPYKVWSFNDGEREKSKQLRILNAKKIVRILKERLKEISNGK